jgi:branched-chain amino acid transport system ATP-binding protein
VKYSLPVADRVVVLKTGGVIYEGDPEPLMDHQKLIELF